jgi:hypothetical protein
MKTRYSNIMNRCLVFFTLVLMGLWSSIGYTQSSDVILFKTAVETLNKSGSSVKELKQAQTVLKGLANKYDGSTRLCMQMGKRKKMRGPGGVMQWIEGQCERWESINPDRKLASIITHIKSIEVAQHKKFLAAKAKIRAAEIDRAKISTSDLRLTMSLIESYKDGVLDPREPVKVNVSLTNSTKKALQNLKVSLHASPADYLTNKQASIKSYTSAGQITIDSVITDAARAGKITLIVAITADNLVGTLTKEVIGRVRN